MIWHKKGLVHASASDLPWAYSNASFPTVDELGNGRLRIYYTALDEQQFGRTGYVEVEESDPSKVVHVARKPVLDLGELGLFDDCGATAFSVATKDGVKYMYYQGWQRTLKVPYAIFTGLATSQDGGITFRKHSNLPVLDRTADDPFIRGAPFVIVENGKFRMWYVSCLEWIEDARGLRYQIVIRHAESADGVDWIATPGICLSPNFPDEYALGRPVITVDDGIYRMWYSIRSLDAPYRLGFAESLDGLTWTRRDEAISLDRSAAGWDSEMVCYGYVVTRPEHTLMFYNGNRHGATGFGLAMSNDPLPAPQKTSDA